MKSRSKKILNASIKRMSKEELKEQVSRSKKTIIKAGVIPAVLWGLLDIGAIVALVLYGEVHIALYIGLMVAIGLLSLFVFISLMKMVSRLNHVNADLKSAGIDPKSLKK
ncbi:MAG: hypothetical protein IJA82_05620 [Clostridia bacterium]|nr:hypothetical protein [Clostridia bacterium]